MDTLDKQLGEILEKYLPDYAGEILDIDMKYGGKLGKVTDESHKEELDLLELYIREAKSQLTKLIQEARIEELEKFMLDANTYGHRNGDWELEMKLRIKALKQE